MKVGEYVRTKKGYIAKYKGIKKRNNIDGESEDWFIFDSTIIDDYGNSVPVEINKSYFIKSSPNIIDLIEVGDYVNGCLIVEISEDPFIKGQINLWTNMIISEGEPFPNEYYKAKILEKDIKSIVTKEQFAQMEYKVGEVNE